ncbi:MAG: hypothetical protein U9Q73_02275 [Nanoarchaeota archaeon]|nr:hypothetical protein [Nanoarchaeota archaeon]
MKEQNKVKIFEVIFRRENGDLIMVLVLAKGKESLAEDKAGLMKLLGSKTTLNSFSVLEGFTITKIKEIKWTKEPKIISLQRIL